jgi:putative toxin-antitoxin system antitoxin component (TIGR02293 family)
MACAARSKEHTMADAGIIVRTRRKPAPSGALRWPAKASAAWFVTLFSLPATARVEVAKRGVPAAFVSQLAEATGESKAHMVSLLGLSRATVDRKARDKQALSVVEGERVIGFAKLVGQVQTLVHESGDPQGFDAARWLAQWLERPIPALGGRLPAEYMDTLEGQQIVAGLLERTGGAYA